MRLLLPALLCLARAAAVGQSLKLKYFDAKGAAELTRVMLRDQAAPLPSKRIPLPRRASRHGPPRSSAHVRAGSVEVGVAR